MASFSNTWWLKVFSQNSFIYETQQDTFLIKTSRSKLDFPSSWMKSSGWLLFPIMKDITVSQASHLYLHWLELQTVPSHRRPDLHPCTSHTAETRCKDFSPFNNFARNKSQRQNTCRLVNLMFIPSKVSSNEFSLMKFVILLTMSLVEVSLDGPSLLQVSCVVFNEIIFSSWW